MKPLVFGLLLAVGCQSAASTPLTDAERDWCRENDGAVYAIVVGALSSTTPDGEPMLNWIDDPQLMQWVVGGDTDAAEGDERYRAACRTAYSDR
jgi:hypothetical protein